MCARPIIVDTWYKCVYDKQIVEAYDLTKIRLRTILVSFCLLFYISFVLLMSFFFSFSLTS